MAETKINGNVSESSGVEDNDEEPRFDGQMARNMVFQCNACNTILGDSTAWVTGEPDLGTFTLRHVSEDVEVCNTIQTSQTGLDEGSTYKDLRCGKCETKIGRFYLATTHAVDHLRKFYTLYATAVKVYELNNGEDDMGELKLSAHDLPSLNLHEITLHLRKVQGIILHMCSQLVKVSKVLDIPLDPALQFSQSFNLDQGKESNGEEKQTSLSEKKNISNGRDDQSDTDDGRNRHSRSAEKINSSKSTTGKSDTRRKRDRSESTGTQQLPLGSPSQRKKKHKR